MLNTSTQPWLRIKNYICTRPSPIGNLKRWNIFLECFAFRKNIWKGYLFDLLNKSVKKTEFDLYIQHWICRSSYYFEIKYGIYKSNIEDPDIECRIELIIPPVDHISDHDIEYLICKSNFYFEIENLVFDLQIEFSLFEAWSFSHKILRTSKEDQVYFLIFLLNSKDLTNVPFGLDNAWFFWLLLQLSEPMQSEEMRIGKEKEETYIEKWLLWLRKFTKMLKFMDPFHKFALKFRAGCS